MTFAIYIRRSMRKEGDADVSDEAQESAARSRIPEGAHVREYRDSGGHNSGFTTDRPGYQRMLADLRRGELAGIAAYDSSRLHRNAENALALLRECQDRGVTLLVSDGMRPEELFQPDGELSYGLKAIVDQHYRSQQAKRVRDTMQAAFETGRQRGHDPFGYGSVRDEVGRIVQPRLLVEVPHEAEIVRRVFRDLASMPLSEVADGLNREGIRHRTQRPWTTSAIKDLWRRRDVYRGFVVKKRGLDIRPGTHDAILDQETYDGAVAGMEKRKRRKGKGSRGRKRDYLLRGLVHCSCGARMRGGAKVSRGNDWRYYTCPVAEERSAIFGADGKPVICPEKSVRADDAEAVVLAAVAQLSLPDEAIRDARDELRRRLRAPASGTSDKERARLQQRIENLRKQHEWGDISDNEYRSGRADAEAQLAGIPDNDKLVMFDRQREILLSMAENIKQATPAQLEELIGHLVGRVEATDRRVVRIVWTPPAQPFFAAVEAVVDESGAWLWRPRRCPSSGHR